jgi:short-subunit dehydrogenase involved in D-alanine esterification of teichoic acids
MELMATEISVFDTEEFEKLISEKDIRIANALVDTVLSNLKGKKQHHHALSVLIVQEQTMYDITIDRKEFITTLKNHLPIFEEKEMYERCAEMVKAIEYLNNKPKRGRPKKNLDK